MTAIKEYSSTLADSGLTPSQLGISASEAAASTAISTGTRIRQDYDQAGRAIAGGIGSLGEVAAQAYKQMVEQPDINKLAVQQAQTLSDIHDAWDDTKKNSSLNDPTIGQKFLDDDLEQHLNNFVEGATTKAGKQYAFDQAVAMRNQMFEKTTVDVATRQGQSVMVGMDETKNTLSNAVRKDPSSFDVVVASWKASTAARLASSPGIDANTASKISTAVVEHGITEFANAAILGAAEKNPAAAKAMLDSGKFDKYVDGVATAHMIKQMDVLQKTQDSAARAEAARAQTAEVNAGINQINTKITDPDTGKITVTPQDVAALRKVAAQHPTENPELFRAQFSFMNARINDAKDRVDNPTVANDLTARLFDKDNPTTLQQIIKAGAKDLSDHTFSQLRQNYEDIQSLALKDPVVERALDAVKADMTYADFRMGTTDPKGAANLAAFTRSFLPQYLAIARSGTPAEKASALNINDPNSLISQTMKPWHRDMAQRLADMKAEMSGGVVSTAGVVPVVPAALKGIAALGYSPTTKLFYDQTSGKAYDPVTGIEVTK